LVIPTKGEHCCKVQNAWWCDGVGKDSYAEFDMSICEPHLTCDYYGKKFGIPATCARPECGEWCRAECQKVDLVTACERPECKNLKLTYGTGSRTRSAPALNCDGYKPCCGSKDYFKEHYGGKTAYPSNQACKQQFSSTKCVEWGHQLGMGALDLSCVPLRQQCPQAHRQLQKGPFKLCCGSADVYQAKYGMKHQFDTYSQCDTEARTKISCAFEFGPTAQASCVPAGHVCPGA